MRNNVSRSLAVLLLSIPPVMGAQAKLTAPPPETATEVYGPEKIQLLTSARSQYYNLRVAGLKSFGCMVDMDWNKLLLQFTGTAFPAGDPLLKYLTSARLGFTDDLDGKPVVKWAFTGTPPEDKTDAAAKMTGGMVDVLKGFLQAWAPSEDGSIISLTARSLQKTTTGYLLDDATGASKDILTLDRNFLLTHTTTRDETTLAESDFTFTKMPQGLVLTRLEVDSQSPPSTAMTYVTMEATYAPVDTFLLPQHVSFAVRNVASFSFRFTGCAVIRQSANP